MEEETIIRILQDENLELKKKLYFLEKEMECIMESKTYHDLNKLKEAGRLAK